jgi:hypothetical protein
MEFKFRASGAAPLLLGEDGLTDKQEERLLELQSEKSTGINKNGNSVKWTDVKAAELTDLITKKFGEPELSVGAKTFIKSVVEKHVYQYKSSFSGNKKTEKGWAVEDQAIELYNLVHLTDLKKSEEELSFGPFKGHPDIIDYDNFKIPDAKSSWDKLTFPKFEEDGRNSDYEWQDKLYLYMKMKMTGDDRWRNGGIFYALISTPENLLSDFDLEDLHYVDNLPLELRYTEVPVTLTDEDIAKIERRGIAATKYANEYYNKLINKNK